MNPTSDTLVLGVGNYVLGDEGIGVHLTQELAEEMPEGLADVLDGGTAGFQLMGHVEAYRRVIMVDATLDEYPTGTIRLIHPKFSKDFPRAMSTHEVGLRDLVEALNLTGTLPEMYLFVVSVKEIYNLSTELSPEVRAAMGELKTRILDLCWKLKEEEVVEV